MYSHLYYSSKDNSKTNQHKLHKIIAFSYFYANSSGHFGSFYQPSHVEKVQEGQQLNKR